MLGIETSVVFYQSLTILVGHYIHVVAFTSVVFSTLDYFSRHYITFPSSIDAATTNLTKQPWRRVQVTTPETPTSPAKEPPDEETASRCAACIAEGKHPTLPHAIESRINTPQQATPMSTGASPVYRRALDVWSVLEEGDSLCVAGSAFESAEGL